MDDPQHLRVIQRLGHAVVDDDGERVEDAVPAHLLPFASANILHYLTGKASLSEELDDLEYAFALMPHQFSDGHRSTLVMLDHAGLDDLGIDEGDPAHHTIALKASDKPVFRIHTVLQS